MLYSDCNLHLDSFQSPLSILKENFFFNVNKINNLCQSIYSYNYISSLVKQEKSVLLGIGLHPNIKYNPKEKLEILSLMRNEVKIIGECGLDFISKINSKKKQLENLYEQLEIANKNRKIIVLHIRNAEEEILEILNSFSIANIIFHWYSGSIYYLKKLVNRNYYFAFNNCVLYSEKYQKYIKEIPLQKILLESDAPIKFKGKITRPEDFPKIISNIAKIKGIDFLVVQRKILETFNSIFAKSS